MPGHVTKRVLFRGGVYCLKSFIAKEKLDTESRMGCLGRPISKYGNLARE
jgi:hypothetical protein